VYYRTVGSSWLVQDVESAPEQSTILADLRSDSEYEVKIRPYFNELQGVDSLLAGLRTPEEGEDRPCLVMRMVDILLNGWMDGWMERWMDDGWIDISYDFIYALVQLFRISI